MNPLLPFIIRTEINQAGSDFPVSQKRSNPQKCSRCLLSDEYNSYKSIQKFGRLLVEIKAYEEKIAMTLIEKYKTYRKIGMELNHKIMKACLDRDVLMKSARLLDIVRVDTLIFDSEDETSVLMDFALNEYRVNDKNAIEIYREKMGWQNEKEKDILDALLSSYTSLFKVISVSEAENSLLLNDILNKKDNIKLIDIAFSKTAVPGLLLFIRLVPLKDFNMTSGISFIFRGDLEKYLLRIYKKLSKTIISDSDSTKRFVSFFRLNKIDGMEVRYE